MPLIHQDFFGELVPPRSTGGSKWVHSFTIQSPQRLVCHAHAIGCAGVKRGLLVGGVTEHGHDLVRGASGLREACSCGLPEAMKSAVLEARRIAPFPEGI